MLNKMSSVDMFINFIKSGEDQTTIHMMDSYKRMLLHTLAERNNLYSWSYYDSNLNAYYIYTRECRCGDTQSSHNEEDLVHDRYYGGTFFNCLKCGTYTEDPKIRERLTNNVIVLSKYANTINPKKGSRRRHTTFMKKYQNLEFGIIDPISYVCTLVILVSDNYLHIKQQQQWETTSRWFNIAKQLPLELQEILCHRTFGSSKLLPFIHSKLVAYQARTILRKFCYESTCNQSVVNDI